MKDEWDEWLARIVCYCFDLSPQALVKEMNRATAQTGKQAAQEEGLEPLKLHRKDMMDAVLVKAFDAPDLEYAFLDEEIADPAVKAQVFSLALGGKPWLTQDEARGDYGKPPMTPEQKDELNPAPPPMVAPGPDEQGVDAGKDQAAADERKRAAEIAELRARSDNAAALGLAVATGLQELAKSLKPGGKKTVQFGSDANGVLTSATLSNGKDQ